MVVMVPIKLPAVMVRIPSTAVSVPTAFSAGLEAGVAGEPFVFSVQVRDVKQDEVQTIMTSAPIVAVSEEVQTVTLDSGTTTYTLSLYGVETGTLTAGTSKVPSGLRTERL